MLRKFTKGDWAGYGGCWEDAARPAMIEREVAFPALALDRIWDILLSADEQNPNAGVLTLCGWSVNEDERDRPESLMCIQWTYIGPYWMAAMIGNGLAGAGLALTAELLRAGGWEYQEV
jgi:hypothetical protein